MWISLDFKLICQIETAVSTSDILCIYLCAVKIKKHIIRKNPNMHLQLNIENDKRVTSDLILLNQIYIFFLSFKKDTTTTNAPHFFNIIWAKFLCENASKN